MAGKYEEVKYEIADSNEYIGSVVFKYYVEDEDGWQGSSQYSIVDEKYYKNGRMLTAEGEFDYPSRDEDEIAYEEEALRVFIENLIDHIRIDLGGRLVFVRIY